MVLAGRVTAWGGRRVLRTREGRLAAEMKPIAYMAAAAITSWVGAAVLVDPGTSFEIFFGMLGPLAAVSGTWLVAEWVYRERPEQLTSFMAAAFFVKMVFFGAYVAVMVLFMRLRPVPFVVSFTSYFIGLYLMEALYLKRLFSKRSR